jgi:hypothetical protein
VDTKTFIVPPIALVRQSTTGGEAAADAELAACAADGAAMEGCTLAVAGVATVLAPPQPVSRVAAASNGQPLLNIEARILVSHGDMPSA